VVTVIRPLTAMIAMNVRSAILHRLLVTKRRKRKRQIEILENAAEKSSGVCPRYKYFAASIKWSRGK